MVHALVLQGDQRRLERAEEDKAEDYRAGQPEQQMNERRRMEEALNRGRGADSPTYDDTTTMSVLFPDVAVGDTVVLE